MKLFCSFFSFFCASLDRNLTFLPDLSKQGLHVHTTSEEKQRNISHLTISAVTLHRRKEKTTETTNNN